MKTLQPTSEHFQLLKIRQVMKVTCLARSTVYKYCADNNFPKPIQLGKRNAAWVESEVKEWIEQKMLQRAQPR
ncbi:AlpA family transcriptional regulator [Shewanella mesophila]|uniref:helix-turn-helix transcriptional regulator n=1 Tax=Shewanella mesophila TaxID=2864208 RepID=UPI001C65901C|nr:AlpA family transcriptional regulator [Shewanella mesophila]QYJ85865.1 AlpA family transcriptional regulator [Shewanella mesophila]